MEDMSKFQFFSEEQLASLDDATLHQLEENCNILEPCDAPAAGQSDLGLQLGAH